MLQFYLAKIIKRIEFQGNSTRYFCSMLQFYLAKIIKRSEFDYADFYYQRYLLFHSKNFITFAPNIIADYIYEHQHEDIIWSSQEAIDAHHASPMMKPLPTACANCSTLSI